jgi:hypothetical protein
MKKKLGDGGGTRFWLDIWVGPKPLCEVFPRLYSVSTQPENLISQMGEWRNEEWVWSLNWRRRFFMWEEELLGNLMELIGHVKLSLNNDSWVCDMGAEDGYSAKEGYNFLCKKFLPEVVQNESVGWALKKVWESLAPMKIMIFFVAIDVA